MVERDLSFARKDSGLIVPEAQGKLTHIDIARMFGVDYRRHVAEKARAIGLSDEIQFFDEPMPHEGSQAVYLVEQFVGNDLILVSVLGPNMKTSKHHHESPMVQEIYFHIAGESFVSVGEEEHVLNLEQLKIEVPLGVVHQVRTQNDPALTLIIMEKALLVPNGRLHIKDPR